MESSNRTNFEYLGYKPPKLGKVNALYIYRKINPKQFTEDYLNGITKIFNNYANSKNCK